jgi:hypothetical protein
MKALLDFIKYNNAFPVILFVTLLATGAAFAASPELRESVFVSEAAPIGAPEKADASKLLATDVEQYDPALRIDAIREDIKTYYITYSYQTFEVAGNTWQEVRKTKHLDVPKELLGKRDLKEYLSSQINQVIAQEQGYLREAKILASGASSQRDSLKYAALVGQEIEPSQIEEKGVIEENEEGLEEESIVPAGGVPALSQEEIQKMIIAAVAEFLAVDMSMPEAEESQTPETASPETGDSSDQAPSSSGEDLP